VSWLEPFLNSSQDDGTSSWSTVGTYFLLDFTWVWRLESEGSCNVIHGDCWGWDGWANPHSAPASCETCVTKADFHHF